MKEGNNVKILKKFKTSGDLEYLPEMDKYIGQTGKFLCYDIYNTSVIKFSDGKSYLWLQECLELVEDFKDKSIDRFDEVSEEAYKNCLDLKEGEYAHEDEITYPPNEALKAAYQKYKHAVLPEGVSQSANLCNNLGLEYSGSDNGLELIKNKDFEFYEVLTQIIDYLASTYSDKYEDTESLNYSKRRLMRKDGKAANLFTALKYIQRYDTEGYKKSDNIEDIKKSIHYLLFELQRRNKHR